LSEATFAPSTTSELRVVTPKVTIRQQLRDMWRYRELLGGLVRKELKVKYKGSVLGFVWSLLNPALYLGVYYFVFQIVLGNGIERFAIFILCGLLIWNFFSGALGGACGAVVANSSIVKKVAFPREILALASTGAALVHFCLQSVVLFVALIAFRHAPEWTYLPLLLMGIVAVVLLAAGLGIWLSGVNVKLRDTQHLLELVILVWFWMTPIVYPFQMVANKLFNNDIPSWLYLLNPITPIVLSFQRVIYNDGITPAGDHVTTSQTILPDASALWYTGALALVILLGIVIFFLALRSFGRMQGDFAEEL
jgi:ABC-2 type transport system permease protein